MRPTLTLAKHLQSNLDIRRLVCMPNLETSFLGIILISCSLTTYLHMPTTKDATDTAKSALGWIAATNVQYNPWRRKMHTYFENNGIVFRRDATKAEWHMAGTYAKKVWIGFPAAGFVLIGGSNNAASAAREHLQYLLLDILKKGHEQTRKTGLPATSGKRKQGTQAREMEESNDEDGSNKAEDDKDNDNDDDAEQLKKRHDITANLIPKIVVQVYIVDAQYADDARDGSQPNAYTWATCHKS